MSNLGGAYVRRQEMVATEAEVAANASKVLLDGEMLYVKMNNGTLRAKMGDGQTSVGNLPYTQVFDGNVVQITGDSETAVMSQKAATDILRNMNFLTVEKPENLTFASPAGAVANNLSYGWNAAHNTLAVRKIFYVEKDVQLIVPDGYLLFVTYLSEDNDIDESCYIKGSGWGSQHFIKKGSYIVVEVRHSETETAISVDEYAAAVSAVYVEKSEYCQLYPPRDGTFFEEGTSDKILYFTTPNIQWRGALAGGATIVQLAEQLGVELVKSPNDLPDCIAVPDENILLFNTATETFIMCHRGTRTNPVDMTDKIFLFGQSGGRVTDIYSGFLPAYIQYTHRKYFVSCYPKRFTSFFEENTTGKTVYFAADAIYVRGHKYNDYTMTTLAEELGLELVTSPSGKANCIAIPDEYVLYYDVITGMMGLSHRGESRFYHSLNITDKIILIAQNGGVITEAHTGFLMEYLRFKEANNEAETVKEFNFPNYWDSAVSEVEELVHGRLSAAGVNGFSFGFITDVHFPDCSGYGPELMRKVMDECDIPVCIDGGDVVPGSGIISKTALIDQIKGERALFDKVNDRCLRAIGNHDPVYGVSSVYDSELTDTEIYHHFFRNNEKKLNIVYGEDGTYFYSDNATQKVRYIILNSSCLESATGFATGQSKVHIQNFGNVQLTWLANVALDVPEGYSVVICSHVNPTSEAELKAVDSTWSESSPIDYSVARGIVSAFVNKTEYQYRGTLTVRGESEAYNINADYTKKTADFICWIIGHTHKDLLLTLDDVNIVSTANDSRGVSTNAVAYAPPKTAWTDTEDVMDFFCVNKETRRVDVIRLGAKTEIYGQVRSFSF